jgi:hypothetical protein
LDDQRQPGLLILFYDPGWYELLDSVGANFDPNKFYEGFQESIKAQDGINALLRQRRLRHGGTLEDRVRFITVRDLYPIVNNLGTAAK